LKSSKIGTSRSPTDPIPGTTSSASWYIDSHGDMCPSYSSASPVNISGTSISYPTGSNIILTGGGTINNIEIDWKSAVSEIGDEQLLDLAIDRYKNKNMKVELLEKFVETLKD
jgi:hypothetical protein